MSRRDWCVFGCLLGCTAGGHGAPASNGGEANTIAGAGQPSTMVQAGGMTAVGATSAGTTIDTSSVSSGGTTGAIANAGRASFTVNTLSDQKVGTAMASGIPTSAIVRDNESSASAGGDFIALMFDDSAGCALHSSRDNGATWSVVSGAFTANCSGVTGLVQDSAGIIHAAVAYAGDTSYVRATLSRANGHVTGAAFTTPVGLPAIPNSLGWTTLETTIAVVHDGSGAERLMFARVDGDNATRYRACVSWSPLNAVTTADFKGLDGKPSSWTALATQTQASTDMGYSGGWAPYYFAAYVEPYGNAGNVYVVTGPVGQNDKGNYGCAVKGQRLIASGTTWRVDAQQDTLSVSSYESFPGTSYNRNGKAYFVTSHRQSDSGTGTFHLHRIAADGVLVSDFIPPPSFGTYVGEPGVAMFVDPQERVVLGVAAIDYGNSSSSTQSRYYVYDGMEWSEGRLRLQKYDGNLDAEIWGSRGSEQSFALCVSQWTTPQPQAMCGSIVFN